MRTSTPATLVPPVRLGRLLADARMTTGESLSDLVRRSGLAFEEDFFAEVEAGRASLDEPLVRWLAELYGVHSGALVPARSELIIDLNEGHVAVGEHTVDFDSRDPDRILTNYLALVYALRGLPVGTPIPLRQVDLVVLSEALRLPSRQLSSSLGRMMLNESEHVRNHSRGLRRRLIVPTAGILVGLTAMGGLLLVRSDSAGANGAAAAGAGPSASAQADMPVQIGQAVLLERSSVNDTNAVQVIRNS